MFYFALENRHMKALISFTFYFYFENTFIKAGDRETRKGLGQRKQQERA